MPKLRIGIVNYLNSMPLAWGFLKGHHADLFQPSYHSPARVAQLLATGDLEIGLIPSIELQRLEGLKVLPDLCVSATCEARSVLLLSRGDLSTARRVALDENSRTSAALLKILLSELYGLHPEYVQRHPPLARMMEKCDAALLIGDPALKTERGDLQAVDLAAEWKRLTGLPFVFAVWAVREDVHLAELLFYFKSSLRYGLSSLDALTREAAAELQIERRQIRDYLTNNIRFFLRDEELAGLEEFYRKAHAHGLIAEPKELVFWSE